MDKEEKKLQIQPNWLLFFLFLIFLSRNDTKKLDMERMSLADLDKKAKFLNRIKGYMEPEEQYVLHGAETILQIIKNLKVLTDPPRIAAAGVRYPSLTLEDRKRNLLIDISEFLEDEKKLLVHQAVDFDIKVKTLEKKLKEIHSISQKGNFLSNIHEYIEVVEPLLTLDAQEKAADLKKLLSVVNVVGTLRNKENFEVLDIVELVQPFIPKEQRESLGKMVQLFQIVNAVQSDVPEDIPEEMDVLGNESVENNEQI
ncbi:hypothetical protein [Alkaliphilus oremlandii]|uniref:Uncharacterized protein n=1 Tax=Alkaliphilus oremlandii (strain OhILAs) TaxID=350688 RepID=A8MF67_ALKOO|nr:hypothetical protein [Alkaliphilus oremlandii]ABW18736.1 hypothetical protein Clos_1190 [Alkaliphilus oremlandii OhILAs]